MAFHAPVRREFVLALRVLAAFDLRYAEAWRLLRPTAARIGVPRPSYATVRRVLIVERERRRRREEELDRLLSDLFAGRFPYVTVEHKLVGTAPGWETRGLAGDTGRSGHRRALAGARTGRRRRVGPPLAHGPLRTPGARGARPPT